MVDKINFSCYFYDHMTARNEQPIIRIDSNSLRVPEAANIPPDRKFVTVNQVEGVDGADVIDLSQARRIVLGEDSEADLPMNTDAYLPSAKNATDVPTPLYVVPKRFEGMVNEVAEDSAINDEIDEIADIVPRTPPESLPTSSDTVPMPKKEVATVENPAAAAELKLIGAPALEVTPETAPVVAKWYDQVFDRAVKFLDTSRAYFNPPKEPTAEVLQLRDQRRKLHEAAAKMFSKDTQVAHDESQNFVGTTLDLAGKKYTVESFVAKGGFGATFIARDENDIQRIVKITRPFDRSAMFYKDVVPTEREQHLSTEPRAAIVEVAALDRLSYINKNADDKKKPYIKEINPNNPGPQLIDAQFVPHPDNKDQRVSVIVMEYVPGVSLTQFMAENQAEPLVIIEAVKQVVDKLQTVHEAGIVHSDIKPANILVSKDGSTVSARLIDAGAAVIQFLRKSQDENSPQRSTPTRVDRLLGRAPVQKPVYAQEAAAMLSPTYSAAEVATIYRDRYSLGRSIQAMVFGKDFRDPARMEALTKDLPYPKLHLARIAEQLTKSNPRDRIPLERVHQLLEELKTTETNIEKIQDQLPS